MVKGPPHQPTQSEQRDVQWVPLSSLRLDPENPRLREGMERASQAELLEELAREYELGDVGQSLADNGYFAEEPLVTILGQNRTYTVIEGNRRFASLLLLQDPNSAPKTQRERWRSISESRKKIVDRVPILVYKQRSEITPYLGFRHITGVLQWKPYQKARYISQLVEGQHLTFAEIARVIGSKAPTVREHYVAYAIVRQARNRLLGTDYAERNFGVLRRALSDPDIRAFIGLDLDKEESQLANPVPSKKATALSDFFKWAFGDDTTDAAMRDSRDLKKLGTVLSTQHGVEILRSTNDLDHAFSLSGGEEQKLLDALNSASYHLDQSLPLALRHNRSRTVVGAVKKCRDTLTAITRFFPSLNESK